MNYILKNGSLFSEIRAESFSNETGSEMIGLYTPELPDSYLRVMNEIATEVQQKTYEELSTKPPPDRERRDRGFEIPKPFNICVLGEVTDEAQIRIAMRKYFQKKGVAERDWNIEFLDNRKIEQGILSSLKKGRSKFNLILIGQIHSHSMQRAKIPNIDTELAHGSYVDYMKNSDPRKELTSNKVIEAVDNYLMEKGH